MDKRSQKSTLILALSLLFLGGVISSGLFGINWTKIESVLRLPKFSITEKLDQSLPKIQKDVTINNEESVVINVVNKVSPAVVTVSISTTTQAQNYFEINPFDPFSPFRQRAGQSQKIEQDIGSGFIIDASGLVVTNKHVVGDTAAKYRVITKDDKTYDVVKIFRDPVNDLAILKINASGLPTVEMGNSDQIKVGQLAIAIGTALGEFRNTVTTGVISGIGRGITAGSPFEGYAERLDNVIQTDAAINPGNSGGPLLNSSGQVVGVNAAVSSEGQNIGFALPINVVRDALDNFNKTGQFDRPYLGIRYKVITRDLAIMNDIPEGAYIMEVVAGSPAETAGLAVGDIVTKIDDTKLSGANSELSKVISSKKVGQTITVTVWTEGKTRDLKITLANQNN